LCFIRPARRRARQAYMRRIMAGSRKKRSSGAASIPLLLSGSRENPRNLLSPMSRI
jgi:hypothetical protein